MLAVAAVGVVYPAGAADRSAPGLVLGGYSVSAAAVPMSLGDVSPKSAPAAVTSEAAHVAYTEAATESGQRSRALASPLWSALPETEAMQRLGIPGVESTLAMRAAHPGGPGRAGHHVAGGPAVAAAADGESAMASASASLASVGGLVLAEELAGLSESVREADTVVGRGQASIGRVQILGGLLVLEGVVTRVRVVSDGVKAVVEGNTTVNRVTVAGKPAALTSAGFIGLPEGLDEALTRLGITVRILETADAIDGPGGSRSVGGLMVRYDSKTARNTLDDRRVDDRITAAMPNQWGAFLAGVITNERDVTVRFGQVAVNAAASPEAAVPSALATPDGDVLARIGDQARLFEPGAGAYETAGGESVAASAPARIFRFAGGVGIPAILVALALLTALALAGPLSRIVQEAAESPSYRR